MSLNHSKVKSHFKFQFLIVEKYGYPGNQNIYGIDQFIGEPKLWGKRIGSSMIRKILDYLSNNKGVSKIVLEVKKNNKRAISSYKKCGFKKIKEFKN